jgi:energy-coupling factor transport system permease protein
MLHPVTWVTWTVAVAAAATLTFNPFYLALLLGVVSIQYAAASQRHPRAEGWRAMLRLAATLSLFVIPFNALNAHAGSHVLFRLPSSWPIIGGNITLEAILWGTSTALSLLVLIVLFAALNVQVGQAQMLRLTPAFIYEAGLIVSIALTFIPQMAISAREIREAQLIRGHRMRRARDMLPLVVALLTTGLERSLQLAESMEARGYGNVRALPRARDTLYKALSLLGLAGVLGGAFALTYAPAWAWAGWALLLVGAGTLIGVFWAQGRRVARTHYRRARWMWYDGAAIATAVAVLGALVAARVRDAAALQYYPYAELLPPFVPWLGSLLLLLVVPVVLGQVSRDPSS